MIGMYKAMPDLQITIEDMVAEADKVVSPNIWRWTDEQNAVPWFVPWRFEGTRSQNVGRPQRNHPKVLPGLLQRRKKPLNSGPANP